MVLLSGRPTGLEGTIDLFINKLAISPDRVIPLSHYPPGSWFPFGGSARFPIGDPKTATVVGCMLCALSERHMTNFTMYTNRLAMRSTANYIGVMQLGGKLMERDVLFTNGTGANRVCNNKPPPFCGSLRCPSVSDNWPLRNGLQPRSIASSRRVSKPSRTSSAP